MGGLTPGQKYVFTQYARGFGEPAGRLVNIETSDDNAIALIDQDLYGDQQGCIIKYSYTGPSSGELTVTYTAVNPDDTWHHYAFTNELAVQAYLEPAPIPSSQINVYDNLSWELVGNVDEPVYNIAIATDQAMTYIADSASGLVSGSYAPELEPETTYFWQVDVYSLGVKVCSSPVWSFNTLPVTPDAEKLLEWKFDEENGVIAQQTGLADNADGILVGFDSPDTPGISRINGLVNNAFYLNGKDEYVDISSAYSYMPTADGQSFAISGYFCTYDDYGPLFSMRNSTDEQPIIDITLGADGVQDVPGRVCLLVRDDSGSISWVNSGITVNDGHWHNFLVTRVGSQWTLYIDGISRAVINNAATGNVDLDMLAIGTSLRWIADNWQPGNNRYRDFHGILDEFCVWDGELQPHQINDLISILPDDGDFDYDQDIDVNDLGYLTQTWLGDLWWPVQPEFVLEDMEGYLTGENDYNAYWHILPESGYGSLDLSVLPDSDGQYGQIMQMDYDFSAGGLHAFVYATFKERGINMGLFNQFRIRLKKAAGCEISKIIVDFYDGRDKAGPALEDLYIKGSITFDISGAQENEWLTLNGNIPDNIRACTDLYAVKFSIEDGGSDIGALYLDSMMLTDQTEDCIPSVKMLCDINSDCIINMLDFVELANNWLEAD